MRRLGIDPGTRRVGVAVAEDDDAMFASARPALAFVSHAACGADIARLAKDEGASEIIVGLPLGMDGREGLSSRHARALAHAIEAASGLTVVLWDERMTSQSAHRALGSVGHSAKQRKGKVDSVAATMLLESYLASRRARSGT